MLFEGSFAICLNCASLLAYGGPAILKALWCVNVCANGWMTGCVMRFGVLRD